MTRSPAATGNRFVAYTIETFREYRSHLASSARHSPHPEALDAALEAGRRFGLQRGAPCEDCAGERGAVDARGLLADLLLALARDRELDEARSSRLDAIQQRFEVRKRLYASYDRDLRQGAGETEQQPLRALLALCLLLRFAASGSYNDLNTALKLCDLLVADGLESAEGELALPVVLAAALLGERHHA